jgi:predicted Zn-dependent peptidase
MTYHKKLLTIIILLLFTNNLLAQKILNDLTKAQSTVLKNGLTIICIKTNEFNPYLYYDIIIDFNPIDEPSTGASDFLADYLGFSKNGKTQLIGKRISTPDVVDTMFNFFQNTFFAPTFNSATINRTKKIEIQKINSNQYTLKNFEHYSDILCFGKNSIFSKFPNTKSISKINGRILQSLYMQIIRPSQTTIVVTGNISPDTVFKYANISFSNWNGNNFISPIPKPKPPLHTEVSIKTDSSHHFITFSYPINFFYTDNDFIQKQMLFEIFKLKFQENNKNRINSFHIKLKPLPEGAKFYLFAKYKPDSLQKFVTNTISLLRDMLIYLPIPSDIHLAKNNINKKFDKTLNQPHKIAYYAYIIKKYNLPDYFFTSYKEQIKNTSATSLSKSAKNIFLPDNTSIFIEANPDKEICQLVKLANFFKINFYDNKFRKYKILPQNFNSQYIINDFLNYCHAYKHIDNLTIKFSSTFIADTIYHGQGIIYKRPPNYFYFKSQIFVENDTLLQLLRVSNNKYAMQKNAIKVKYFKDRKKFNALIYQSYVFAEKFYSQLFYYPIIECSPKLMNQNIFKIKILTPYDYYINNYYNLNTKEKTKTEIINIKNAIPDTLQIIKFTNYKKISNNSDLIFPYTITQKTHNFKLIMNITKVDDKTKIRRRIFHIKKPKLSTPKYQ